MPQESSPPADGTPDDSDLAALRVRIDAVDGQLLDLLNQRARLALEVGEIKKRFNAPVYRPEREAAVIAGLSARNPGPIPASGIESIWREVMSVCRSLERRLRVAYLGPRGTYSEQAALARFGAGVEMLPCVSIDEVFRSTEADAADFGIVPVENWTEGAVSRSLDLFLSSPVSIVGEVTVPVVHNLLGLTGSMQDVTRICAHPQALAQCVNWLSRHYPTVERVPVSSNAEGARQAGADPATAAIAGETAMHLYGLQAIARAIQDDPMNRTRFVVIGRQMCGRSGRDQTSLIVSVPDQAGAVHALIEPLARHRVSMKRFESRPARQSGWEYLFYIDLLGHQDDPAVAAALAEMRPHTNLFKSLGSYPSGPDVGTAG